jgi:hypothetical protein
MTATRVSRRHTDCMIELIAPATQRRGRPGYGWPDMPTPVRRSANSGAPSGPNSYDAGKSRCRCASVPVIRLRAAQGRAAPPARTPRLRTPRTRWRSTARSVPRAGTTQSSTRPRTCSRKANDLPDRNRDHAAPGSRDARLVPRAGPRGLDRHARPRGRRRGPDLDARDAAASRPRGRGLGGLPAWCTAGLPWEPARPACDVEIEVGGATSWAIAVRGAAVASPPRVRHSSSRGQP